MGKHGPGPSRLDLAAREAVQRDGKWLCQHDHRHDTALQAGRCILQDAPRAPRVRQPRQTAEQTQRARFILQSCGVRL